MKKEWKNMSGELIITVEALNQDEEKEQFEFECYISPEINSYDKGDYIGSIALYSAKLWGFYFPEIIEIKEK